MSVSVRLRQCHWMCVPNIHGFFHGTLECQTKLNCFRNVRKRCIYILFYIYSPLFFLKHTEYSRLFSLCVFLIQWSRRSPVDSTVWNGKQHVVRQSPSVLWRLEAACWPVFFNVNRALCTTLRWIFHYKCHSSSEMTPALYKITGILLLSVQCLGRDN